MSEKQWRVVADRASMADETWITEGDRVTYGSVNSTGELVIVRIERPVPTSDEPQRRSFVVTPNNDRYDVLDIEDALINSRSFLPEGARVEVQSSPHPPTREQIAEVIFKVDYGRNAAWIAASAGTHDAYSVYGDAVLALIQNGADR